MADMAANVSEVLRRTLRTERIPEMVPYTKRIEETENHFTAMGHWVEKYAAMMEKLAQKGEKLSSTIGVCTSDLDSNPAVKSNLSNYTMHLSTVQQHRKVLKDTLQERISSDIFAYEGKCQEMRKSIKGCEDAVRKKNHRLTRLEKVKNRSPVDPRRINDANIKFEQARCQAERSREDIKVEMKHFEEQKWEDMNRILGDFLLTEMRFHAQALQEYTAAFRCLLPDVDEEDPPRGSTRGSSRGHSRGKSERKVVFSGFDETQLPESERDHRAVRSDSNGSAGKLSLGDLYSETDLVNYW